MRVGNRDESGRVGSVTLRVGSCRVRKNGPWTTLPQTQRWLV